jgi:hypothetical protein
MNYHSEGRRSINLEYILEKRKARYRREKLLWERFGYRYLVKEKQIIYKGILKQYYGKFMTINKLLLIVNAMNKHLRITPK